MFLLTIPQRTRPVNGWKIRITFLEISTLALVCALFTYCQLKNAPSRVTQPVTNLELIIITISGVRVPFYIVSPWTRGGRVFTEHADHNSQILFIEEWLTAKGYNNVRTDEMVHWRRQNMAHLLNALDFENVRPRNTPAGNDTCFLYTIPFA